MEALAKILASRKVAVTHRYVRDFGEVRMAVVERQCPGRYFKIATEVLDGEPTANLWERLESTLDTAEDWLEAQ